MPFYPNKNPKNQKFEKWKNLLEISFHTCVPKIMIIWCTVPEIQSETGRIFCHFGSFFALSPPWQPRKSKFWKTEKTWKYNFTHVYHKWQSYNWCMVLETWSMTDRIFCHFGLFFLPFYPPNNPKNHNFEKLIKAPWYIITLHMCTINDNQIMYGFSDIESNRQNFLSFWTICYLFIP